MSSFIIKGKTLDKEAIADENDETDVEAEPDEVIEEEKDEYDSKLYYCNNFEYGCKSINQDILEDCEECQNEPFRFHCQTRGCNKLGERYSLTYGLLCSKCYAK